MPSDPACFTSLAATFCPNVLAFGAKRADAFAAEIGAERFDDRIHLARVAGGGDDEVVRERRHLADVHQHDVLRLPFGEEIGDALGEVCGFQ